MGSVLAVEWTDLTVGAAIGAATTAVLGYLFYWLQLRRYVRQLAYRSFSWPLVHRREDARASKLTFLYAGREIPRLTRTRVALWNAGWRGIDAGDVVHADPLSISVRDGEVLEHDIVSVSRDVVGLRAELIDGRCLCSFDFLDRHDGVVLDLLHTGSVSQPVVRGTVKGMPHGIRYFGTLVPVAERRNRSRRWKRLLDGLPFILLVAAFLPVWAYAIGPFVRNLLGGGDEDRGSLVVLGLIGGLVVLGLLGILGLERSRRVPPLLKGAENERAI